MFELPDENIRTVTIPLSDINSVQQNGKFLLRYRVVSKDKNKKSHWSKIYEVDPKISFSELNEKSKPVLNSASNNISYLYPPGYGNIYTASSLSRTAVAADSFIFNWSVLDSKSNLRNFDVYTQWGWYDYIDYWTPPVYSGSTPTNTFAIERPNLVYTIPVQPASWDVGGTTITFETSTPHGLLEGQQVFIDQVDPSAYNGIYNVFLGTTDKTVVIFRPTNPGTSITTSGYLKPIFRLARAIVTESAFPKVTDFEQAENIVLSISDSQLRGEAKPFSVWESPTGTLTANTFTIPTQTPTVSGTTNNWDVVITITGTHYFVPGQQVEITGVTSSGTSYNASTRTIQGVDGNRLRFFFATSTAPGTITGAGTMTCRNLFTVANLASPFTEAATKNEPVEISLEGLVGYSTGDPYTGKIQVVGRSGGQITISTDTFAKPDATNKATNIKL